MFARLEETSLALWVGESLWGYPLMLSLHVIGLAIVVGIFVMRDLRLLGMFDGIAFAALPSLIKLGWIGFIINALSGFALFTSQATTFIESTPFLLKIGSISWRQSVQPSSRTDPGTTRRHGMRANPRRPARSAPSRRCRLRCG